MNATSTPWYTEPSWWEAIGTIGVTIVALVLALWSRIRGLIEETPDLKIETVTFTSYKGKPRGILEFKVKNHGKLMATDTFCDWVINRKEAGERIMDSTNNHTDLGIIGPGCIVIKSIGAIDINPSDDLEIWTSLKCKERIHRPTKQPLKIRITNQDEPGVFV